MKSAIKAITINESVKVSMPLIIGASMIVSPLCASQGAASFKFAETRVSGRLLLVPS
jgi:hypothetical protein